MKRFNIIFIFGLLALALALTGCTKDDTTPDSDRSAYLGKWNVTPTKLTYEVTISEDPNSPNGVFISNFALIGSTYPPASAEVNGSSIVLDANQVIGDGLVVSGSGVLSGNKITWNYTIFDGADLTNVSETYTRK
jgi:hypothetical protein